MQECCMLWPYQLVKTNLISKHFSCLCMQLTQSNMGIPFGSYFCHPDRCKSKTYLPLAHEKSCGFTVYGVSFIKYCLFAYNLNSDRPSFKLHSIPPETKCKSG